MADNRAYTHTRPRSEHVRLDSKTGGCLCGFQLNVVRVDESSRLPLLTAANLATWTSAPAYYVHLKL